MTRKDIISKMLHQTPLTSSQANYALEGIINIMADALAEGEPIMLRGFGTLQVIKRAPKPAQIIGKRTTIYLPERKKVKFTAYNKLQDRIDQSNNEPRPARKKAW